MRALHVAALQFKQGRAGWRARNNYPSKNEMKKWCGEFHASNWMLGVEPQGLKIYN
jgi:hypothetical protein